MRSFLLLALLPAGLMAAPALEIVKPVIAQMEGGDPLPPDFQHGSGETLFFSCHISGFTKSPEEQIHLKYSVQAFDPKGVPLAEIFQNEIKEEVGPQDKDWQPKIETQVALPDTMLTGHYKIVVKVEDLLAKTSAEASAPFEVKTRDVAASGTLVVRNFRWYHSEDDANAMRQAAYHPGNPMFMRYDVTGFKYGPDNKVDVTCVASLVLASGKVIWTQPEPATEQSDAFYPKPYFSVEFGITLQPNFQPGTYTMAVAVKDNVGKQSYEGKFNFTVQ